MKKTRRISLLTATLVAISTLVVAFGSAHAAPVAAAGHTTAAAADGRSLTSVLTGATFVSGADGVQVVDEKGKVVDHIPSSVTLNGVDIPLSVTIGADGSRATITPDLAPTTVAAVAPGVHPVSAKKDRAYQKMIWHINNGWNRGGGVATAVGAIVGLIVGCLVIVGCIWGAGVGAAIGAVVGINNGDPQAGQAILNWINTP